MFVPRKNFKLRADQIRPLAEGYGACIASDMITVHGHKVGCMARSEPMEEADSGWDFTAGNESAEFMDNADNHGVFDVNTIANYDPDIIPFLNAPIGSVFERDDITGQFFPTTPDHE